jgi:hypothetical protein
MSAVKLLLDDYADDDFYKGHPWDPSAPAHYAAEPEMMCEITNRRLPVSELVKTETGMVISEEVWKETGILLEKIQAAAYALELDTDKGYEPDIDRVQELLDAAKELSRTWNGGE